MNLSLDKCLYLDNIEITRFKLLILSFFLNFKLFSASF